MAELECSAIVREIRDCVVQSSNPVSCTSLGLNFYHSEWHELAIFLHLLKDTGATAFGLLSRL